MRTYFIRVYAAIALLFVYKTNAVHRLIVVSPLADSEMDFIREKISPPSYVDRFDQGQLKESDFSTDSSDPQHLPYPGEQGLTVEYDMRAKNLICGYIFNSPLFDLHEEDAVDLTRTYVQKMLLQNYPQIYDDIFGRSESYSNPYTKRMIAVRKTEQITRSEWTLRCLTRRRTQPREFKEYFISPIYNLSEAGTTTTTVISGRFVFTRGRDSERESLSIFAVAEEPPVVDASVIKNTHLAYFEGRKNADFERPGPLSNIICRMTTSQKIRLCNHVFSSNALRDQTKFYPSEEYIEPLCQLEKVITRVEVNMFGVKNLFYRQEVLNKIDLMYEEYMLGCKALGFRPKEPLLPSLYVSRGLEAHTAIIYERLEENLFRATMGLSNVSVIRETGRIRRVTPAHTISRRTAMTTKRK